MPRVAIYARVSTDEQADEGHSIDAQVRLCRELCARKGWIIAAEYVDAGLSGTTTRRPEFQRMMHDARRKEFDIIAVHKLDRFSRSLVDTLTLLAELAHVGISFCSATEDFDFTTPIGRVLLAMLAAFAQYYIDNLRAETKKGKRERALKGFYNGVVPFGYQSVPKEQGGIPTPHAQNADAYREIIRRIMAGQSGREISDWLNANGFRTTGNRGANLFTPDAVIDITKNRFHLGQVAYKGVWRDGKHLPLIDADTWNAAQRVLRARTARRDTGKHSVVRAYPLRQIAYCAECGSVLRGQASHGERKYKDMQAARRACAGPQLIHAETIETELGAYFSAVALPADWRDRALGLFADNADAARNEKQRRALVNELARARRLYIAGDLTDDQWQSEKMRIQSQLDAVQPVAMPDLDKAAALLSSVGNIWQQATDAERANIARALLERVYVRDNKIVALEPRATFYDLFSMLEMQTPPDESDGGMHLRERRASLPRTHSLFDILILRRGMSPARAAS